MTTDTKQRLLFKSFDAADQVIPIGSVARVEMVDLGEVQAHRATFQPGFNWTEHVGPQVETDLCEIPHTGYVVSGHCGVKMADGTEFELAAGDAFDIPPGHDMWVVGDEPYVAVDFPREADRMPLT